MHRTVGLTSLWLCALAAAAILASLSFYTLNEGETGLVLRNGRVLSEVAPGLNWKIPITDEVLKFSSQNNILHITKNHNYTSDLTEFSFDISVVWHVTPGKIKDLYTQYNDFQSVELTLIKPHATETIGAVMSDYKALEILERPNVFMKEAAAAIKNTIGERVTIDSISFDRINLADFDKPYEPAATVDQKP
ncbi:SPFH domain / Band 7 family protein [Pseudomonas sp. NFACC23-1]|uniref:SPFH domain-containing protein n=1 Tax=unclassified Pseudomonas TaxID=196821 RepID=UPI0008804C4F|nr:MULTISPECIES: SPFH domain-containing protein [unclassified Pseudomonas]SDB33658.1 SPFH domain / Band 7 family protein [Pseudomonas sp. NFACC17-2]SEJ49703.1 SPFH domain / Band 7 family protein [Pseudomonas sp. NFACC23-1]SFW70298.1 SPFH domain / Band 7 family protein [Pseudomonas sp. NFACC16-2]